MTVGSHDDVVSIAERSTWVRAALMVPAVFMLALAVHFHVLRGFANSGDEYAYLWQATAFAHGHVTAPSPEPHEVFKLNHIGDVAGRRFCKYPPGWPLLLALGVRAGAPGLVNPLLAALALACMYRIGCSWVGERAALLGAVFTGSSPFFLLNAASFHSHPSCLLALTGLAVALTWATERSSHVAVVMAGACTGVAVLIRPYSACLVAAPMIVAFGADLFRRSSRPQFLRLLMEFVLGGLPFACVLLAVNREVTGSWFMMPWTLYDPGETLGFGVYGHTLWRAIKTTVRLCAEGALFTGLAAPVLIAAWGRRPPRTALLWTLLLAPIAGYFFWWSDGGNRYGPRFYFEGLLGFTLLAGVAADRVLAVRHARSVFATAGLIVAVVWSVLGARVSRQVHDRRDVYRAVHETVEHDPHVQRAVVFLQTASADMVRIDLTRNPPDLEHARIIYALSRGPQDRDVQAAFPDRRAYWYRWSNTGGTVTTTPQP